MMELNFMDFFYLSKKERKKYMAKYLCAYYSKSDRIIKQDYMIAKGDLPVCLVAHVDTVFPKADRKGINKIYYDDVLNVAFSPEGLGADDKAGLFGIIQILNLGLKPSIILLDGEEKGGAGAYQLITDYPDCPVDVKYFIELDRRGQNDCVFYDCDNIRFTQYVEGFGFKTKKGIFSDIDILCPFYGIAGVNLSIGYQDEHTLHETFHYNWFEEVINKVCIMLDVSSKVKEKFNYVPAKCNNWAANDDVHLCPICGISYQDKDMVDAAVCRYCYEEVFGVE